MTFNQSFQPTAKAAAEFSVSSATYGILRMTKFEFMLAFRLSGKFYDDFHQHICTQLPAALSELSVFPHLRVRSKWRDAGKNIHVALSGRVQRRDEQLDFGGEVVWLKRLRTFRGSLWCYDEPKSDWEYLLSARQALRVRDYCGCARLCGVIEHIYGQSAAFRRMQRIAGQRCNT